MTPEPQPEQEYIISEVDLQTLTGYFNAALDGHETKASLRRFWEQQLGVIRTSHSSAKESSDKVLDKAKAKLDEYYKSLPAKHPYLDGIDLSIQKIEELQVELRQQTKERERG